jgi:hypothetical protein
MPTLEFEKSKPLDDQADFVMSFVDDSQEARDPFEDIWEETELNWMVRPTADVPMATQTRYPLVGNQWEIQRSMGRPGYSVLKDPETHQAVMTIASKLVLAAMGERGFVKTKKVGEEDLFRSETASKLLEYALRLEGHFWTFVEWVVQAGVYGTGIIEAGWHFEEGPRSFRSVGVDEGGAFASDNVFNVPIYDDVRYSSLAIRDFYPDPGHTMLSRMRGAAKGFSVDAALAKQRAEDGIYRKAATNRAIEIRANQMAQRRAQNADEETMGTHEKVPHPDFINLTGFEYYGTVPWMPEDGITSRVITVLGGETVRSEPWARRIPFFDYRLTPRLGSFYGIGVAEVMRHDQDLADVLKMMLADSVVRSTHPPHIYNTAAVDTQTLAKLRRFSPGVPVPVNGDPANIQQAQYNPPVAPAFQFYAGVKQQMREGSGALGAIQGLGLGSKRFSASEAALTFEQAFDRPDLWAQVFEREALPAVGKYTIGLYQENLEPDTDDLQRRVGESQFPVDLADILLDFDVEFIGSQLEGGKQQKIAAFREIVAAAANPIVAQLTPWIPLLRKWFDGIGAPEIAAMVGNPELMQLHIALTQLGGANPQGGNNNGTTPAREPIGALPAQLQGTLQQ